MSQRQPYITLDSIILDYMNEAQLSNHAYFRLWHIAYRGMENLGLDAFYQIRSVKLPVNSNLTVTLPADYLNWSKVGVLNDVGEIIPLNYNERLTAFADLSPDRIERTQDFTLGTWQYQYTWYNYWNGSMYTNIYGVPSGQPFVGSFKVDMNNGVILLNDQYSYEYVMLEYIASPAPNNDYYVPLQFREALVSWLRWKDIQSVPVKTHVANSSVQMRRHDYFEDRRKALAQWKPLRISEAYQSSQEFTRLTVRS